MFSGRHGKDSDYTIVILLLVLKLTWRWRCDHYKICLPLATIMEMKSELAYNLAKVQSTCEYKLVDMVRVHGGLGIQEVRRPKVCFLENTRLSYPLHLPRVQLPVLYSVWVNWGNPVMILPKYP